MSQIEQNTTSLRDLLTEVNNLPASDGGGDSNGPLMIKVICRLVNYAYVKYYDENGYEEYIYSGSGEYSIEARNGFIFWTPYQNHEGILVSGEGVTDSIGKYGIAFSDNAIFEIINRSHQGGSGN